MHRAQLRSSSLAPVLGALALAAAIGGVAALGGMALAGGAGHDRGAATGDGGAMGRAAAAPGAGPSAAGRGPVVVELFTSQGCSSCPPADRLLSRLQRESGLAGEVIPLAFHVDYWNHQGWSDPFSSPRWSQRQVSYAHAFGTNRVYTPQLVVGGRTECVGSQEGDVMRRIKEALAAEPAGQVSLTAGPVPTTPVAAPSEGEGASGSARITVSARLLRPVGGPGPDLWVALTESGLTTAVGTGENASATLRNDHVVRRLVKAFTLSPTAGAESSAEVALPLDKAWNGAALEVVAFLQDPRSLVIHGAASLRLRG
jgi:hypothetical protein